MLADSSLQIYSYWWMRVLRSKLFGNFFEIVII